MVKTLWPRARRILPALLLSLLLPVLLFPRACLLGGVISADDHFSVHAAFTPPEGAHVRHPHLSDPAMQFDALRQRTVQALRAGHLPLWNPDIFAGAPLLADMSSQPASPVTLVRLLVPEDLAQNLGVSWILCWTALGTALLSLRLGTSRWGAAIAAAAAGTAPFTQVWLLHTHAASFAWIPWLLWAVEGGAFGAVALCTVGLVTGGHPATIGHGLALAGAWWLLRRRDAAGLLGIACGLLLAAPLWMPFREQLLRSTDLAQRRGNTLLPRQLLDLLWPGWLGHPARGESWQGPGAWIDGQLHPGFATLGLALWSLRHRLGRWLWLGWALCLVASLTGLPLPGNHARLASEAAWLLALAAGLAIPVRWRWKGGLLALSLVLATGAWARRDDQGVIPAAAHAPPPNPWVVQLRQQVGCAQRDGPACGRVLGLAHALQPDLATPAGLRDLRGYDLPVSVDTERLERALDPRLVRPWFSVEALPPAPLLDLAGVRAIISPWPLDSVRSDLVPWTPSPSPSGAAIYLRPSAAPRAWLAPAPVAVATAEQGIALAATSDLVHPPVEGLTGSWPSSGEIVPLYPVEPRPERVEIEAKPTVASVLVLADAWSPGWRVRVDGQDAPLLRIAGVFRGVALPAGVHQIVFRYEAPGWSLGLRSCAVGLAFFVLFGAVRSIRRRS